MSGKKHVKKPSHCPTQANRILKEKEEENLNNSFLKLKLKIKPIYDITSKQPFHCKKRKKNIAHHSFPSFFSKWTKKFFHLYFFWLLLSLAGFTEAFSLLAFFLESTLSSEKAWYGCSPLCSSPLLAQTQLFFILQDWKE